MKRINHLKTLFIIVSSLIISTLLSSCRSNEDINRETVEKNSETVTASIITSGAPVIEAVTDISDTGTDIKAENSDTTSVDMSESGADINIQSNGETVSNTEYSHNDDIKVNKAAEEIAEISDYKYKALLEKYISYMKKEHVEIFKKSDKCRFFFQDIYGGGMPEMAICILYESGYTREYFFTEKENGDILYMGFISLSDDSKLYSDGHDNFIISHGIFEGNIQSTCVYKLNEEIQAYNVGDLLEYASSSADKFIQNTQLTFCRFDEYFDADNDIPAEVLAEDFYYKDTGTYEAYLLSSEILELTDSELSEYRMPYNTGVMRYLAKRDEYLTVKEKLDNMMTEIYIAPEIDSDWIETENIDIWLNGV